MCANMAPKATVRRHWPDFKGKVQLNGLNLPPGFMRTKKFCNPDLAGFIELTSNAAEPDACVGLLACETCIAPKPSGKATAIAAAAIKSNFFRQLRCVAAHPLIIRVMRFLRSEPVTPETQATGDSR